ncbi:MAG TPA: hypothetical protein VI278_17215 [Nitrososphaeraceae archaeon]|jgi:hypothetical protein
MTSTSTNTNNNSTKPIKLNPYESKQSAILWLRNKGIIVVESTTYHSMSFRFIENGPTSKDIEIISRLGSIKFIDFITKTIHIFS